MGCLNSGWALSCYLLIPVSSLARIVSHHLINFQFFYPSCHKCLVFYIHRVLQCPFFLPWQFDSDLNFSASLLPFPFCSLCLHHRHLFLCWSSHNFCCLLLVAWVILTPSTILIVFLLNLIFLAPLLYLRNFINIVLPESVHSVLGRGVVWWDVANHNSKTIPNKRIFEHHSEFTASKRSMAFALVQSSNTFF